MDGYTYPSGGDSRDSSPRSREVDGDNQSWDEPSSNYRVKFLSSFGGKIQPRPHDNQLSYIGGDTKILTINRDAKFAEVVASLSAQWQTSVSFKYQLPGEDLDALISVTNDEDLEHMMMEYDRIHQGSASGSGSGSGSKPSRLRLFLFPVDSTSSLPSAPSGETKPDQKWFVDALNTGPVQNLNRSSGPSPDNPDFLFGLEKGTARKLRDEISISGSAPATGVPSFSDSRDYMPQPTVLPEAKRDQRSSPDPMMPNVVPGVHPAEIQRQIHEFQRMQIASQEQQAAALFQRKQEESLSRNLPLGSLFPPREAAGGGAAVSSPGDYYVQRVQEKTRYDPVAQAPQPVAAPSGAAYWGPPTPDRQAAVPDHPIYILPPAMAAAGYPSSSVRPQGYYAVAPKMMAQLQPNPAPTGFVADLYGMGAASAKIGPTQGYHEGTVRQGIDPSATYSQVVYDQPGAGRSAYITTALGTAPPPYQGVGVELRQPPPGQVGQDGGRTRLT